MLLDFVIDNGSPAPVKPFPAHTDHSLVFYLSDRLTAHDPLTGQIQQFARIALNGVQTRRLDFYLPNKYRMLAVNFQQGFLTRFLGMPMPEFTDCRVDAEAVLDPGIGELYERMLNLTVLEELVPQLEGYLWRKICKMKLDWYPLDRVAYLMTKPHSFSIEHLADMACLSLSQFERRFLLQAGIPPKPFTRINRFYQAYTLKEADPHLNWLGVALYTGYHDYQHLVKDFKTFAGQLPQALLTAQGQSPERILDSH